MSEGRSEETRLEHDSLGEVEVPAERYWGAQTQRSLTFFEIGGETMPTPLIRAYARIKRAAAEANAALGELTEDRAAWIVEAASEVVDGRLDGEFPLRVWQTGSGTQTNMNLNEVIANRANELAGEKRGAYTPVHPNDHVNRGQSTNDTFPTAMHVSAVTELRECLFPAVDRVMKTLDGKSREFAGLLKTGRTHLQDATPISLGQEIGGWAAQLRTARAAVEGTLPSLLELAVGGTAVGTGLNAHPRFGDEVAARLSRELGCTFRAAPNRFAALAGHEALVVLTGALSAVASAFSKIANDVRWMSSGPRCGLNEITLPANEPGSSMMPGKVNPTQAEALVMVCLQVLGNQATVSAAAGQGNFELNVCKPVIAYNVLQSIRLLSDAAASMDAYCLRGLEPNRGVLEESVGRSLMLVTALVPHIGYEAAARVAQKAHADDLSLREAAAALGAVSEEDFDRWVQPADMVDPEAGTVESGGSGSASS